MVNDRFIELLTKELSGEINTDDLDELKAFLRRDAAYKTLYKTFKMYWGAKDIEYKDDSLLFQKVKAKILNHESIEPEQIADDLEQKTSKLSFLTFWRSAAALLFLSLVSFWIYNQYFSKNDLALTYHEKTTAKRIKSILVLSDGTKITLNSQSTLKYPTVFSGKTREVYLSGEAFFDVHKDHEHPFIIHTGKMNIKVLGTEFNVRSYPDEQMMETSLIKGSIEVRLDNRPSERIILKPKEKLIVKNGDLNLKIVGSRVLKHTNDDGLQYKLTSLTYMNNNDSSDVETSWLKNKLAVNNEEFLNLAHKMELWYGVNIYFSNEKLKSLRFTVTFEKENIKQALDALKFTENFQYKMDKSNIYIY